MNNLTPQQKFEALINSDKSICIDNVKGFILSNNIPTHQQSSVFELEITQVTEKAVKFVGFTDYGTVYFWCPKSCLITNEELEEIAEKRELAMEKGLNNNQKLNDFAKANGVKNIRKRMTTDTLVKKILEAGLELPTFEEVQKEEAVKEEAVTTQITEVEFTQVANADSHTNDLIRIATAKKEGKTKKMTHAKYGVCDVLDIKGGFAICITADGEVKRLMSRFLK